MTQKQFLIGIMTCKQLLHKAEEQYQKYFQDISAYPIVYLKFIGDPTIDREYIYDEDNKLLTLKCEDDYLNLPNKVFCFFKAVSKLFPNVTNVVKMDDDVIVNLRNLYNLLVKHKDEAYAGRYVGINHSLSMWLYQRKDLCENMPLLGTVPVFLNSQEYCSGCIYILHRDSIKLLLKYPEYFPPFPKEDYEKYIQTVNTQSMFIGLHVFEDYNVGMIIRGFHRVPIKDIRQELMDAAYWNGI